MNIPLDCKNYVKYLGILIDSNLSWKIQIEYIALKISKIVGLTAKFYLRKRPESILTTHVLLLQIIFT